MPAHAKTTGSTHAEATKRGRGRPANTNAPQKRMMIEDIAEYRSLKARGAPQVDITAAINSETRKIIQHFGWMDPLRAVSPVTPTEASDHPPNELEQKRRDAVYKKVRAEVRKVWRENLSAKPSEVVDKSSTAIAELIKLFARKPRHKQLYKVWAASRARPDLEAEVDKRHAAKMQQSALTTNTTPRVATWNEVASEWYHMASKKEKKATRKERKRMYRRDKKAWELSASAMPDSPEEAIDFMEASQGFLSDLMHFFANRASGIAVMFLSGPDGARLISEGVCNVSERPKLLYTEVNPEDCEHFEHGLAKQTQILNADKNGDGDIESGNVEFEGINLEGEGVNAGNGDSYVEDEADDDNEETDRLEFLMLHPPAQQEAQATRSHRSSDASTYDPLSIQLDAETNIYEPNSDDDPPFANLVDDITPTPNACMATYFAFDAGKNYTQSTMDAIEYTRLFRAILPKVLPHKPWLEESNTVNFLRSVPNKLGDRIGAQLACDLSMAYLNFEASKLDEFPLDMKTVKTSDGSDAIPPPDYVAGLQSRSFTSRWNGRAGKGEFRTPAKLDADINIRLPHQWALLQPKERLDEQGRICRTADVDMSWKKALAPGIDGARLLVVTALVWVWNLRDEERSQWSYLAIDMIQVLRILCHQDSLLGTRDSTAAIRRNEGAVPEGRKRSAREWKKSAKLRELEGTI
ncbi:unnamed protein product [Peniophora sp. CBMAI 1063]|nr:unnamed protein product [Peniophora sp. CBMAI 1063]